MPNHPLAVEELWLKAASECDPRGIHAGRDGNYCGEPKLEPTHHSLEFYVNEKIKHIQKNTEAVSDIKSLFILNKQLT
jgi:hypothetical protein